jgi:hypothetical protein
LTFEGAWLTSFNQENAFLSSQSMAAAALAVKARAGTTTSVSLAPSPVPALTTAVGGTSVGSPSPSGTSSPSASGGTGGSVSSPPGTLPTTLPSSPPVVSAIDIRLVLQKLSNSQNLTVQEENLIKSIGIGDLAALANEPVFNKFSVGVNTVVKVRFNFKLLNVYKAAATLVDSSGNPLDNRSIPIEDLNFATFKSDLYCAIVVNDGSVDTEAVLDLFYTDFFVKHFQPILSQLVVLENIQIQCFWPFKALGAFDQSSYDAIGDCPASQLISSKPFCFNLTSSLVKSKKNAFQFAIPGVTKELQDRAFYETKKTELAKFCKILMSPIKLGAGSLVLSLVMPTKKANTPVSFVAT